MQCSHARSIVVVGGAVNELTGHAPLGQDITHITTSWQQRVKNNQK